MSAALEVAGLRKSFGRLEVLRGIDLAVAEHAHRVISMREGRVQEDRRR